MELVQVTSHKGRVTGKGNRTHLVRVCVFACFVEFCLNLSRSNSTLLHDTSSAELPGHSLRKLFYKFLLNLRMRAVDVMAADHQLKGNDRNHLQCCIVKKWYVCLSLT